ncbi:MAG: beta-lactamase family protein [Phycisphaeraceae bacterium]|nr:beta-lactamase family protein [Phycisphaerales bacterium]MCB9859247.1 beta-lactamase family protein [Phycisphaeraceae bacterium]
MNEVTQAIHLRIWWFWARRLLLLCASAAVLTLLAACQTRPAIGPAERHFPQIDPSELGLESEDLRHLVEVAEQFVADDRIVGAEMLIVKNRKTILHEAVGWSDREAGIPLKENSYYRLRSMTKPFTGTAALMLIDRGLLRLDSRPAEYFASWDNDRSRHITVEQLLTHTSGFIQEGWPVPAASFDTLQGIVDVCGKQGPQLSPGDQFTYSDVNSFTLGALVTHLSGMPVEQFIATEILMPLGLNDTHIGYSPSEQWASQMNPTYQRDDQTKEWYKYWTPQESEVFPYFRASGGLVSTITDYARWLSYWMDWINESKEDTSPSTRQLLSQRLVEAALTQHGFDQDGGYGYHWSLYGDDPLVFGHSGSDGTVAVAVPDPDVIVLFFTQSRGSDNGTVDEWFAAARALGLHRVNSEMPDESL